MNPFMVTRPMNMLQQLRQNPSSILKQAGYDVPADMTDAQQIINHLLQSGQLSNQRLNGLMQMMKR